MMYRKESTTNSLAKCCLAILGGMMLLASTQGPTLAQDKIFPQQGAAASGKIKKLSPTEAIITVRGKDQTYAISDIRRITFDNEPRELDRARESALQGQFDQALDEVKKLDAANAASPYIAQDIEFYRYYSEGKLALSGKGSIQTAVEGLLKLARTNRNTHHFFKISEMLGEGAVALDQLDKATNYFSVLLSAPDAATKAVGVYQLGNVELLQGKVAEAKTRFEQLAAAPSDSAELLRMKSLADVGLARCEIAAGNYTQALDRLNAMVQRYNSTDQELFALINNAKGACFQANGQVRQALLSYLQTDLLFFSHAPSHAEALYHLSKLFPQDGEPARGAEAKARLTSQYAASAWASKP